MGNEMKVKKPLYKKWWVWLLVVIVFAAIGNSVGEEESSSASEETTETTETAAASETKKATEKKEEEKQYAIGDEVNVDDMLYTVNGVEEKDSISSSWGETKTTDGKYVVVDLTIKNGKKEAEYVEEDMFSIVTADGTEYNSDYELDSYINEDVDFFIEEINPNMSITGKLVFELPADTNSYSLKVIKGWLSEDVFETIKLK